LARAEPVAQPSLIVAKPPLMIRAPVIPRAPQPGVELILHSPLDDQSGAELGKTRQRFPRILTDSHGEQLIDLVLDLRRRRYGTSHGVGLLLRLYRTRGNLRRHVDGSRLFTAVLRRDPPETAHPRPRRSSRAGSACTVAFGTKRAWRGVWLLSNVVRW